MAMLFFVLCRAEARETGNDVWVGFAWKTLLEKGYSLVGVNPALPSKSLVHHGMHSLLVSNRLSVRITSHNSLSVLFPTPLLLRSKKLAAIGSRK